MAEREGFEPSDGLPRQRFSRPSHSATLAPLRNSCVFFTIWQRFALPSTVLFAAMRLAPSGPSPLRGDVPSRLRRSVETVPFGHSGTSPRSRSVAQNLPRVECGVAATRRKADNIGSHAFRPGISMKLRFTKMHGLGND